MPTGQLGASSQPASRTVALPPLSGGPQADAGAFWARTVWLGGLPDHTANEPALAELLGQYGGITSATVRFKPTARRSWAVVTFDDEVSAAICLDDPDFAQELVDEHDWDHITHGGMDLETKEKAKAAWGFSSVPHLVVIGADGATLSSGSALKATAASVEEALAGKENAPAPVAAAPVFSLADDDF